MKLVGSAVSPDALPVPPKAIWLLVSFANLGANVHGKAVVRCAAAASARIPCGLYIVERGVSKLEASKECALNG